MEEKIPRLFKGVKQSPALHSIKFTRSCKLVLQSKLTKLTKKQRNMTHCQEKKKVNQ